MRSWAAWVETAVVFLVFALYAAYPVPEPNEPHYLGKAKHYWNPAWIERDFFLDSADSHWAFYVAFGWLTRFASLPATAWIGRIATWALLAAAWRRLSFSVVPRPGAAILSAVLFVALCEHCHMAGEWAVGGFEAKGVAYALVFAGLAELVRNRWNTAWILFGAAAAFHVLVGGWAAIAAGLAWLASPTDRPRLSSIVPGLAVGLLLSLAGVIPALRLTLGADPLVASEAAYIYVYERLPHHLSFFSFRPWFRLRFAILILTWLLLDRLVPADTGARRLRRFISATLVFVAIGIVLSVLSRSRPDLAARLLRYYWFRFSDVMLPAGVALGLTGGALLLGAARPRWRFVPPVVLGVVACALLAPQIDARLHPAAPRADKAGKVRNYADWRDACAWIAANTPADARFLTPRSAQTFKWHAERSEVVTWKDLPQDAESIVAWWRRLNDVHGTEAVPGTDDTQPRWHASLADLGAEKLQQLGLQFDAQYVLTEAEPPLDLPCLYRNDTYAVYRLSREESQ